ncbi:hypothetical protein RJT34_15046 [Clitoria ternatea]|uniref:MBD domain-containing protein n=1 Tax=Clitoria ternatea TaxID=43366 RepID=A0AAN9JU88_CLITE
MQVEHKRGRKQTTTTLWEAPFSFEAPPFCIEEKIDLEKVLRNRASEFPVLERMQNWMVERRQRQKEGSDIYYHHLPTKQKFRTRPEVINFLLHGTSCSKPVSRKKRKRKKMKRC